MLLINNTIVSTYEIHLRHIACCIVITYKIHSIAHSIGTTIGVPLLIPVRHVLPLECDLDVLWTIILDNALHFCRIFFLLDFTFNIFLSLIMCLIITSPQYEWSLCFEVRRQNGFAPPLPPALRCNQKKIVYLDHLKSCTARRVHCIY